MAVSAVGTAAESTRGSGNTHTSRASAAEAIGHLAACGIVKTGVRCTREDAVFATCACVCGGAGALVSIDKIHTHTAIQARVGGAFVNVNSAGGSRKSRGTAAREVVDQVGAGAIVQARIGCTLVDIKLTAVAAVSCSAVAPSSERTYTPREARVDKNTQLGELGEHVGIAVGQDRTVRRGEACLTLASVRGDSINAGAFVETRVRGALIDIRLAKRTSESVGADA